jgi:hypothetical protein
MLDRLDEFRKVCSLGYNYSIAFSKIRNQPITKWLFDYWWERKQRQRAYRRLSHIGQRSLENDH